jgi:hypothetical protein
MNAPLHSLFSVRTQSSYRSIYRGTAKKHLRNIARRAKFGVNERRAHGIRGPSMANPLASDYATMVQLEWF